MIGHRPLTVDLLGLSSPGYPCKKALLRVTAARMTKPLPKRTRVRILPHSLGATVCMVLPQLYFEYQRYKVTMIEGAGQCSPVECGHRSPESCEE